MATNASPFDDAGRMTALLGVLHTVIEDCIATGAPFEVGRRRLLSALGAVGTSLPIDRHGRRPKFFTDMDVRERLIALHREVPVSVARERIETEFGRDRTPSRSAVYRFWIYLDRLNRRGAR